MAVIVDFHAETLETVTLPQAVLKEDILASELTMTEQRQHVFLAHTQSFAARRGTLALVATIKDFLVATANQKTQVDALEFSRPLELQAYGQALRVMT
ncbi:hypothetical protein N7507_005668 [Penicillium longicatenatum]|nr:hypothetical protein N7507_005668 [Penicillium longicatenatum]